MLALAALTLQLPANLYALHRLRRAGLATTTETLLLDRTWPVPHLPVFLALAALTLLIPPPSTSSPAARNCASQCEAPGSHRRPGRFTPRGSGSR